MGLVFWRAFAIPIGIYLSEVRYKTTVQKLTIDLFTNNRKAE